MNGRLWLLPLLLAGPVAAQPPLVRLGTHGGFGRVVFEFAEVQPFTSTREGNSLQLSFPTAGDIPDVSGTARNIAAVTGGSTMATVTVNPNTRIKVSQLGARVVVDVLDPIQPKPPPARVLGAAAKLASPSVAALLPRAEKAEPVQVKSATTTTPKPFSTPAPVSPEPLQPEPSGQELVKAASEPTGNSATSVPAPSQPVASLALAGVPGTHTTSVRASSAVLPFGPTVAAAAFRHDDETWVIFDDRRPLDLNTLKGEPAFEGATVELLPTATLLRLRIPATRSVHLERKTDGWLVVVHDGLITDATVMPSVKPSRLLFSLPSIGSVVTIPDASTGRNLLVGTLRSGGPGVPVLVRMPELAVLPSLQGVVVEPVSDRVALRAIPEGFIVETGGAISTTLDGNSPPVDTASLTRRFEFPAEPVTTLLRRLQSQVQDAGRAPTQARLPARKAAAQTMLALGLGAEAQSLLRLAVTEDPRAASDADVNGLAAIAALLGSRTQEAAGLASSELDGSDEVTFWRALRSIMAEGASPQAAQALATSARLVLAYPDALRNRLLPVVAEALVAGGAAKAADALLDSLPNEPRLLFAKAARLEQIGKPASALAVYDTLAGSRDRLSSARAMTRALEVRFETGSIGAAEASDQLEHRFADWRGDGRERDLRLETADIAAQAGQWRKAFAILTETAELFPDDADAIGGRMSGLLTHLLNGPAASDIKPLEFVALAEENAAMIAKHHTGGVASLLADKLIALDLPQRAAPVLQKIVGAMPPSIEKAIIGARLAELRLGEGDHAGAASALSTTEIADLPDSVSNERALLNARMHASVRDTVGALAILARIDTVAAFEMRASILTREGDWHGAALALENAARTVVSAEGPLTAEQQDFILRLASAHSRAGDLTALQGLEVNQGGRMSGARADMFRLLTATPVNEVSDLGRLKSEVAVARMIPASMGAIGTR